MIEPQMINPYTYCFTTEVPYYQCDLSGKMKLSWLLKVMERAAGEHLEHIGLSYDRLYQEGIVFLLSKAAVRIHRCPTAADLLWVETAPQGVRGAQYNREIRIHREENGGPGELLAEVHTIWFMADPVERRILRPDKFQHEMPTDPVPHCRGALRRTDFYRPVQPSGCKWTSEQYRLWRPGLRSAPL